MNIPATLNSSQLRWRCRRGMLELDILLNSFLDNSYAELNPEQMKLFHTLLDYPDQVLFDLFMDKAKASDNDIAELVSKIKTTPGQ